jgi:hypothetical protein
MSVLQLVAGNAGEGIRGGLRVDRGQEFGCGQAHLVADAVIAGDG